jgi:cyclopropane fatty-acyl-phospholipid synthase-like methyltransferase
LNFYKKKKNVEKYLRFTPSYDGSELVQVLEGALRQGSTVLELGMGPGKDFDLLIQKFSVTGSDASQEFINLNRERNAGADLMLLDARTLDTDRRFDCIYSNKVLIHLTREELVQSLARQYEILNENGLLLHSFWRGSKVEEYNGLRITYYTEQDLTELLEPSFEILDLRRHAKMVEDDSVYVLARKTG